VSVPGWTSDPDVEKTVTMAPVTIESHESWLPSEHPMHRPRHARRQFAAMMSAAVFFLVPALTLAMGARPAEFENHRLAPLPSPLQGWRFFTGLSDWATDHLPFRDAAIRAADGISRGAFGEPPPFGHKQAPVQAPPFAPPERADPGAVDPGAPDLAEPPLSAGFPPVVEGRDGWLYYGFDFQSKCRPLRPMDETLGSLRRLRTAVEASGRRFVLVVPPDKSTVVPQNLPASYAGKDCAAAASEQFWPRVTGELGAIDLRADLGRITQVDGTPPYHKLDTHWDDRGAIMMTRRVTERLQPGVSRGWKLEPGRVAEFPADLPKLIGRTGDNRLQTYSLAPDGERDRTGNAVNDLRSPAGFKSTPGPGMVDSSVGVVCDSFSLPATRYLPAVFAEGQMIYYSTLLKTAQPVLDVITGSDVVVFEVVERNLVSGFAAVVDPANVDLIVAELARHPRR
jgi:hypothetical protein